MGRRGVTEERLRTALVVGGGVAGLWAAAALVSAMPGLRVTVVDDQTLPPQPLDCQSSLLPGALAAMRTLGIGDSDLLSAGGRIRLGQQLHRVAGTARSPLIPEGQVGVRIGFVPFARSWLEAARTGDPAPFEDHAVSAAMISQGRFAPPTGNPRSPLSTFDYGINVDPAALRGVLTAAALGRGARILGTGLARVEPAGTDRLAAVVTTDQLRLEADLFVDATGHSAHLLSCLRGGSERESWGAWLPADTIWTAVTPADTASPLADGMIRHLSGWRLRIPLANCVRHLVMARSGDHPQASLGNEPLTLPPHPAATLVQGLRRRPRIGNCVAIGDAAATIEPIGGWPLALLAREVDQLTATLSAGSASLALERAHGDRLAQAAAEVRDMAALSHHLATRRRADGKSESLALPDSAAAFLTHFEQRGTLPRRDHVFVTDDEWYAFLIALGARTSAPDPLAAEVAGHRFDQASEAIRAALRSAVAPLPLYPPVGGQ